MRIGYSSSAYTSKRNIIDLVPSADYVKVADMGRIASHMPSVVLTDWIRTKLPIDGVFYGAGLPKVDLLHLFNQISFGRIPWITTFGTVVPRYPVALACHGGDMPGYASLTGDKSISRALTVLAGDCCKKVIALSECNAVMQKELLQNFPEYRQPVESKLCVIHPPQELLIHGPEEKRPDPGGAIKFMFVGRHFFRKGGMEVLEAFSRLQQRYAHQLQLVIVSSLSVGTMGFGRSPEDVDRAKRLISANSDWIRYYASLSNQDVLGLMKKVDVGLLPTWADTYGYSVLEFQAAGCPVITTDVRALPEINDDSVGWMIEVPKNRLGEGIYATTDQKEAMRKCILDGLVQKVGEILEDRASILDKSARSLERIEENHSPLCHAQRIVAIYGEALQ